MSKYETRFAREMAVSEWILNWILLPMVLVFASMGLYVLPIAFLVTIGWEQAWGMVIWLAISVAITVFGVWATIWIRKGE